MNKWEYSVIYVSSYSSVIDDLNKAGEEGWELVAIASGWFYLKRPIPAKVESVKVKEQARPQMPTELVKKPAPRRKKKQAA